MRRHIPGFIIGFCLAAAIFLVAILPRQSHGSFDAGFRTGEILTKLKLMEKIPVALGDDYKASDGYNTFFEVKADAVVVVERNGVKTLRNYVGGR